MRKSPNTRNFQILGKALYHYDANASCFLKDKTTTEMVHFHRYLTSSLIQVVVKNVENLGTTFRFILLSIYVLK